VIIAVVGSAPCWSEDLQALRKMLGEEPTICVLNRSIQLPLYFDYFLTGHQDAFAHDVAAARARGQEFKAIGVEPHEIYDEHFKPQGRMAWGGSAANAICYFCSDRVRVVLCGCPFDESGYFDDKSGHGHCDKLWHWFLLGHPHRAHFSGHVRSMSGNTKELFGYPTKEWLHVPSE